MGFNYRHKSIIDKRDAIEWLKDLLLNPDEAYKETVFKIRNPEILSALSIEPRKDSRYSFNEISVAMNSILDQLHAIHAKPREDRSQVEDQLADLYVRTLRYLELSRSLTGLIPEFVIENETLARSLDSEPGDTVSYFHFVLKRDSSGIHRPGSGRAVLHHARDHFRRHLGRSILGTILGLGS